LIQLDRACALCLQGQIAKADTCVAMGFLGRHPGRQIVVGAQFDMRAQFGFDIALQFRTAKQIGNAPYQQHGFTSRIAQHGRDAFH